MSIAESNRRLLRHYGSARTPWGRWRLNFLFRLKWVCWLWQLHSGPLAKRAFDICVSLILLILLIPLFLIIGILVKCEDGGRIFFAQTRTGQFGREFKMFKIRSMCLDAKKQLKSSFP